MENKIFEKYLNEYLKAYWLRPVTALVRTLDAMQLNFDEYASSKSLELACGDGINSYIAAGGKVPFEFDVFKSIRSISPEDFFSGRIDIYDNFEKSQYNYDFQPGAKWTKGIDHKNSLLEKAELLGCFENLELVDLNNGFKTEEPEFDFVFSNSLYWIENIDTALTDIYSSMKAGATAKFNIIKPQFLKNMAWSRLSDFEFKKYFDNGRHKHYQQILDESSWLKKFEEVGFSIAEVTPSFNENIAHMIEFHDLREISPVTSMLSTTFVSEETNQFKSQWIEYYKFLFTKMWKDGYFVSTPKNSCYNLFVLRKI